MTDLSASAVRTEENIGHAFRRTELSSRILAILQPRPTNMLEMGTAAAVGAWVVSQVLGDDIDWTSALISDPTVQSPSAQLVFARHPDLSLRRWLEISRWSSGAKFSLHEREQNGDSRAVLTTGSGDAGKYRPGFERELGPLSPVEFVDLLVKVIQGELRPPGSATRPH